MATNERNIVLTGFMGTGKTTVGRLVAQQIGWQFVDSDDAIVERAGLSIPEIFTQHGEEVFRQIEREVCRSLAVQQAVVIATGGGMLVDAVNRQIMLDSGFVVCLMATPAAIESRLTGAEATNRPLLQHDWIALFNSRQEAYNMIPHQVDTTDKSPDEVAQEIVNLWRNA